MKFIMPFVTIIAIYVALHLYVYSRVWQSLEIFSAVRVPILIFLIILGLSYFMSQFFGQHLPFIVTKSLIYVGASWIYIIMMAFMAVILIDMLRVSNHIFHWEPQLIVANYKQTKFIVLCGVAIIISVFYMIGNHNFFNSEIQHFTINLNDTPTKTLKITQVTDLHLGYIVDKQHLAKFVEKINETDADIVCLVGDTKDMSMYPIEYQHLNEELSKIKSKYGVFVVSGNHEYINGEKDTAMNYYRACGLNVLEDGAMLVNNELYVVGRKDKVDINRIKTAEIIKELDRTKPIILLNHQPFDLQESVDAGVDLQLSGHTHNGQFFPINLIVEGIYEKAHGYLQKEKSHFIISSGIGGWGPPIRMGSKSEIIAIELRY